jgi:hypothetical protein
VNTYLFGWNPIKYPWPELADDLVKMQQGIPFTENWTCASHKKIKIGDRAFFVHVGSEPKGLFASGYVSSEPFKGINRNGRACYRVNATFDVLLNPSTSPILTLELLNMSNLSKQNWTPQASGISIQPALVEELELLWKDFLEDPFQIALIPCE